MIIEIINVYKKYIAIFDKCQRCAKLINVYVVIQILQIKMMVYIANVPHSPKKSFAKEFYLLRPLLKIHTGLYYTNILLNVLNV